MYGANGVHIVSLSIVNTWFPASTPLYLSILQFNQPLVSTLPDLCIQGFKSFDSFGSADDSPEFQNIPDIPCCHGLRKKVSDRGPFDRPGHDCASCRIRGKLIEKPVADAAARDIELVNTAALDLLQPFESPAVLARAISPAGAGTGSPFTLQ